MSTSTLSLIAASLLVGPVGANGDAWDDAPEAIVIEHCLVSLVEEVTVPSQDAGVLLRLEVREGKLVTEGEHLGQIDDASAQAALEAATAEHARAKQQAENDIDVRHAQASAAVSSAELMAAEETNRLASNAVSMGELRRLRLAKEKDVLGTEQSQVQQQLAGFDRDAQAANIKAAALSVQRRLVASPLDGVVVEIFKRPGEWVQVGEPILRLVRMNRLRVEGFLSVYDTEPQEVAGQAVTIEAPLKSGRVESFEGRIVFVNPLVHAGGQYRVWAEVENRQERGQYLLRPGHEVRMTIEPDDAVEAPPVDMATGEDVAAS